MCLVHPDVRIAQLTEMAAIEAINFDEQEEQFLTDRSEADAAASVPVTEEEFGAADAAIEAAPDAEPDDEVDTDDDSGDE